VHERQKQSIEGPKHCSSKHGSGVENPDPVFLAWSNSGLIVD
jgi:hypothetical protein